MFLLLPSCCRWTACTVPVATLLLPLDAAVGLLCTVPAATLLPSLV